MNKKIILIITSLTVFWFVQSSCYYDKEELLKGGSGCDTTNVKYSTTIKGILDVSCNGCHSGASPSAGISLADYTAVKTETANPRFYGCLTHDANYSPMPKGGSKLDECKLSQVKKWLDAGAPNN